MSYITLMDNIKSYFSSPYIDEQGAEKVRRYNYVGHDHSKIVKYLQPFWNKTITYVPLNISPNIITLFGGLCALLGTLLVTSYSQNTSFIFLVYAISLFCYQTMDALDGLQGKKVGMYTNPTTEVFDHGMDATVTILSTIASIPALQLTSSWMSVLLTLSALSTFYILTWENTTTKVMIFRSGFLNPTDSLVTIIFFFFVTAFFPNIWSLPLRDILFLSRDAMGGYFNFILDIQLNHLVVLSSVYSALYAGWVSCTAVLNFHKERNHHTSVTDKDIQEFFKSLTALLPLVVVWVCGFLWLIAKDSAALQLHPYLTILALSLPWNYAIMRLIVSEISYQDMDVMGAVRAQFPLLVPLVTPWVMHSSLSDVTLMFVSLLLSSVVYGYVVGKVVGEVCDAVGMAHFWTIPGKSEGKSQPTTKSKYKAGHSAH